MPGVAPFYMPSAILADASFSRTIESRHHAMPGRRVADARGFGCYNDRGRSGFSLCLGPPTQHEARLSLGGAGWRAGSP
jgi:hypothetical protein